MVSLQGLLFFTFIESYFVPQNDHAFGQQLVLKEEENERGGKKEEGCLMAA